jgi:hypothetical protein
MFVVLLKDYLMAEPENHMLRLLREIRGAIGALEGKLDGKIDSLDKKIDRNQEELQKRIDSLRQASWARAFSVATPPPNSMSGSPPSNSVLPRLKAEGDLSGSNS